MTEIEKVVARAISEHVKCDAYGLTSVVAAAFIVGIEDAATAALIALHEAGYAVVPREPTDEMRVSAVQGMHFGLESFLHVLRAEGRAEAWGALNASCSSRVTDEVWRAIIAAAEDDDG